MACRTYADPDGNPNVFNVERNDNGSWLNNNWANPDNRWNGDNQFVFRLRKRFFSTVLWIAVFLIGVVEVLQPAAKHSSSLLEF